MKVTNIAAAACAGFALVGSAAAQTFDVAPLRSSGDRPNYIRLNVGGAWNFKTDLDGTYSGLIDPLTGLPPSTVYQGRVSFDPGFFGSVAFGRKMSAYGGTNLVSAEIEGFYEALNPKRVRFGAANVLVDQDARLGGGFDRTGSSEFFVGRSHVWGGLVNLVYHFETNRAWRPRIGAGLGYARVSFDIDRAFEDSDGVFAYQAFAGLGRELNDRLELELKARYLGTTRATFNNDIIDAEARLNGVAATVGVVYRY